MSKRVMSVNIDGEGDTVGLWIERSALDLDIGDHAYVFLGVDDLRRLAWDILEALPLKEALDWKGGK